jgi:uncharacterized surface protein with fasciclin (FAS1) repeats
MMITRTLKKPVSILIRYHFSLLLLVFLSACYEFQEGEVIQESSQFPVYKYLKIEGDDIEGNYEITCEALRISGLAGMLNSYGDYTFFAPDDEAWNIYFQEMGYAGIEDIDSASLREIIVYHIFNKIRDTEDFFSGFSSDTTARGDYLVFDISEETGKIRINFLASFISTNILVTNGIVHCISRVLTPPNFTLFNYLETQSGFSIMKSAFEKADLKSTLNILDLKKGKLNTTYTVFVEMNDVFEKYNISSLDDLETYLDGIGSDLTDFCEYHVVSGKRLDGAKFTSMLLDQSLVTLEGNRINIVRDNGIFLNQRYNPDGTIYQVPIDIENSNVFAKNGALHSITEILTVAEEITPVSIVHECETGLIYNEVLDKWEVDEDSLVSWPDDAFLNVSEVDNVKKVEFLPVRRNESIEFTVQNILSGEYEIILGYEGISGLADIQLYIDGAPIGEIFSLSSGSDDNEGIIGNYTFESMGDYTLSFKHVTDGGGIYDYIKLNPVVVSD